MNVTSHERLMLRKLLGITTADEDAEFEAWLTQNPRNRKLYLKYKEKWQSQMEEGPEVTSKVYVEPVVSETTGKRKRSKGFVIAEACAIALMVVATVLIFAGLNQRPSIYNAGRKITKVQLTDSSTVILKPGSVLLVASAFGEDERAVQLEGQAFFDIKDTQETTFTVTGDRTKITVLGTAFLVDFSKGGTPDEVHVLRGEASISSRVWPEKQLLVSAGNKAVYNNSTDALFAIPTDTTNLLAWKTKKLVFYNTPLADVLVTLETYFGFTFEVEDDRILACSFTRTFAEPSLDDVLKALHEKLGISPLREYSKVIIRGNGCV